MSSSVTVDNQEVAAALALLDCAAAKNGSISESDFADFLKNDNALETLTRFIVPKSLIVTSTSVLSAEEEEEETRIKRSFYAMMILIQLTSCNKNSSFMKDEDNISGKIGLICKILFQAYHQPQEGTVAATATPHIPHVNHLLQNLLIRFPSVVISSACVGGKSGIQNNIEPMIEYKRGQKSSSSPALALFSDIIIKGCCGISTTSSSNNFNNTAENGNEDTVMVKKNIRRKFIHSLCEWGFVSHMVSLLTISDNGQYRSSAPHKPSIAVVTSELQELLDLDIHIDGVCDALITVTDAIAFPTITSSYGTAGGTYESCGESALLKPFGEDDFVKNLVAVASAETTTKTMSLQRRATTAARALMTIFKLSFEKRKADPTLESTGVNNNSDTAAPTNTTFESTMISIGIADRMYQNLLLSLPSIVRGILYAVPNIDDPIDVTGEEAQPHDDDCEGGVRHPGKTFVKRPFTTRRLHLITLLADTLSYECEYSKSTDVAMDTLLELCNKQNIDEHISSNSSNIWSGLIHLLFSYPNNNLFQVQFYRLLLAILIKNHEPSLKLVIQKCKLVTLFLKATLHFSSPCLQGCILQCLNAIRLRYQSLPPKSSYLCTYLDSHDGWKAFLPKMLETTKEQRIFGGGIAVCSLNEDDGLANVTRRRSNDIVLDDYFESTVPVPASPTTVVHVQQEDYSEIDLGSTFAAELGLNMFKKYTGQEPLTGKTSVEENSIAVVHGKKHKKKNKKNKKK